MTTAPAVADGATAGAARPTVVLVHGAFADASSWSGVTERLRRGGYTVMAPVNPLRGLYSDAAHLASVLKTVQGPLVLAGHSYGGAVISTAAAGNPQVKSLVYINALMPDAGRSGGRSPSAHFPGALGTATASVPCRTTGSGGSGIPSWAPPGRQDRTVRPSRERFEARRAHSRTGEVGSCHVSLGAAPDVVAGLIVRGATAAAAGPAPRPASTGAGGGRELAAVLGGGAAAALVTVGAGVLLLGRRRPPRRPAAAHHPGRG
ncbi:alpha/beta fold hydrolase [Streptomyces sp. NPDC003374]